MGVFPLTGTVLGTFQRVARRRAKAMLAIPALVLATAGAAYADFDYEQWKQQYGNNDLSASSFYSSRGGSWGDYFSTTSTDCALGSVTLVGPLGFNAWPYDQALATDAFNSIQPSKLRDGSGLIVNSLGIKNVIEDGPSDGKLYPDDVIVEMEGQPIKRATNVSFPFTVLSQSSRGLEIHTGQLVDAAEGRGKISLKIVRGALTAASGSLTGSAISSEVTVDVTGKDYVRLVATGDSGRGLLRPRIFLHGRCLLGWVIVLF
jgi:hypothetical protein